MLNIRKTEKNGSAVFYLEGRLDTVTAPNLEIELRPTLDEVNELILDLNELEYISSAGLRVLLSAQKVMRNKGGMKVTGVNATVMEIFEVTGFSEILTIV